MRAVQHLAGNAAVGDLLARQRRDRLTGGPAPALPALSATPRLRLQLPGTVTDLLTIDDRRARRRTRTAVRLDATAVSGDHARAPVTVATSARTTLLRGTLRGLQPLAFDGPLTGLSASLAPELAFALRVGRVDLARGGCEAAVSIDDDRVAVTIRFVGGEVRLRGALDDTGDAPADWDIEVALEHRACARLLGEAGPAGGSRAGGRRTGGNHAGSAAAAPPPPDETRDATPAATTDLDTS